MRRVGLIDKKKNSAKPKENAVGRGGAKNASK